MQVQQICQAMSEIAPLRLAEDWDNVGLLLGHRSAPVERVMTCLTVSPAVVSEAEKERVDLIVAHHPLPFKPLSKITSDTIAGELVWRLCRAGVALYSAHTAYDSAAGGINEQWCEALGLAGSKPLIAPARPDASPATGVSPTPGSSPSAGSSPATGGSGLRPNSDSDSGPAPVGSGRYGDLPEPRRAGELLAMAASFCGATRPRIVGDPHRLVRRVGVACGSGGGFLGAARRVRCELLLSGEATFHQCLEAENTGISLALLGHYASERFAMESLARRLQKLFEDVKIHAELFNAESAEQPVFRVWASRSERDVIWSDKVDSDARLSIAVDPVSENP